MSPLTIEMLGQAATLIRGPGATVLTDPWFQNAAHLGGWIPYPCWTDADVRDLRAKCDTATHVYISHAHEDHFDPGFLRSLTPKTILVGDFRNSRFRAALEVLGDKHTIRYASDSETIALTPGLQATVFLEQPSFRTNSLLLLESAAGSILDANDCGMRTEVLAAIGGRRRPAVFMYTLNFAANGYPFPYLRRAQSDLAERIRLVREEIVDGFRKAVEVLRPKLAVAFAGPVTFADGVNDHLDGSPDSLDWRAMIEELSQGGPVAWPAPGSTIEIGSDGVVGSRLTDWSTVVGKRRPERSDEGSDPVLGQPQPSAEQFRADAQTLSDRLGALVECLAGQRVMTSLVLAAVRSVARIEEDPPLHRLLVRPGARVATLHGSAGVKPPWLSISSLPSILGGFCRGEVDLDALLLSGRARFARDPDRFDPLLHNLLRFGHDPGTRDALVEWYHAQATLDERETITITGDGRSWVIPRYCPHEGEPLDHAEIIDSCVVCPRHRWAYDLETGRCVRGGDGVNLYRVERRDDGDGCE